jgi:hypothetical protein
MSYTALLVGCKNKDYNQQTAAAAAASAAVVAVGCKNKDYNQQTMTAVYLHLKMRVLCDDNLGCKKFKLFPLLATCGIWLGK